MAGSVGSLSVSLGLDAAEFVDGISRADAAAKKLEASAAKLAAGIDKQVAALQRQADVMGMSARQVKLFDLAQQGATKSQLEAADAALKSADAYQTGVKIGDALKTAIVGIGVAAIGAAAAFEVLVKGAADFQDLSDATGASAESLASLQVASSVAGVSIDSVGGSLNKLGKNLVGVDDDSKAAGAALAALNIPINEFKQLDPVSQYLAVGKAMDDFADGSNKVAVAQALFGKGGAEQLKVLKELNAEGGASVILTGEQISRADDYIDAQTKATATLKLYAQAAATEALPALTTLTDTVKQTISEMLGLDGATKDLAGNNAIQTFAFEAAKALGFLIDAADGVGRVFEVVGKSIGGYAATASSMLHLDFSGAKAAAEAYREDVSKVLDAPMFSAKLNANIADAQRKLAQQSSSKSFGPVTYGASDDSKPQLNFDGAVKRQTASGPKDDPTKKLLENNLKSIEAGIKAQEDALDALNKASDRLYSQNLIGITDYYEKKQSIQNAGLLAEVAGYDREIALLQAHQAATSKQTDKADDQGKIDALLDKRKLAEQKSAEASQAATYQQSKAYEDLAKSITGVNVQVLEMQEHLAEAAGIKFDQSNKGLKDLFTSNGNTDALQQLDTLRQYTVARAAYDQQSKESSRVQSDLQIAEDRVAIAQQLGTQGELTGLKALGDARQEAVVKLQAIVEAQEAVAAASGNPALIQNAEQARVALEKLEAAANPLADKFNNIFETSFGNAFADFITGSKTASEAFQSFAKSVISSLANIAAQEVAKSIFGAGASSSGGIGGLLAGLFSGASASSSGGSLLGVAQSIDRFPVATGTDFVPRDNFPALLHKGEAVVPAAYNKTANRLGVSDGNLTIVNQTTGRIDKATMVQISPTDRALIIQESVQRAGDQFRDPNSHMSSTFAKGFKAERRR